MKRKRFHVRKHVGRPLKEEIFKEFYRHEFSEKYPKILKHLDYLGQAIFFYSVEKIRNLDRKYLYLHEIITQLRKHGIKRNRKTISNKLKQMIQDGLFAKPEKQGRYYLNEEIISAIATLFELHTHLRSHGSELAYHCDLDTHLHIPLENINDISNNITKFCSNFISQDFEFFEKGIYYRNKRKREIEAIWLKYLPFEKLILHSIALVFNTETYEKITTGTIDIRIHIDMTEKSFINEMIVSNSNMKKTQAGNSIAITLYSKVMEILYKFITDLEIISLKIKPS